MKAERTRRKGDEVPRVASDFHLRKLHLRDQGRRHRFRIKKEIQ
jgi:hypothetical protein